MEILPDEPHPYCVEEPENHHIVPFAFRETAHNADYEAKEYIYPAAKWKQMCEDVKTAMADQKLMKKMLQKQKKAAMAEPADSYQRLLSE